MPPPPKEAGWGYGDTSGKVGPRSQLGDHSSRYTGPGDTSGSWSELPPKESKTYTTSGPAGIYTRQRKANAAFQPREEQRKDDRADRMTDEPRTSNTNRYTPKPNGSAVPSSRFTAGINDQPTVQAGSRHKRQVAGHFQERGYEYLSNDKTEPFANVRNIESYLPHRKASPLPPEWKSNPKYNDQASSSSHTVRFNVLKEKRTNTTINNYRNEGNAKCPHSPKRTHSQPPKEGYRWSSGDQKSDQYADADADANYFAPSESSSCVGNKTRSAPGWAHPSGPLHADVSPSDRSDSDTSGSSTARTYTSDSSSGYTPKPGNRADPGSVHGGWKASASGTVTPRPVVSGPPFSQSLRSTEPSGPNCRAPDDHIRASGPHDVDRRGPNGYEPVSDHDSTGFQRMLRSGWNKDTEGRRYHESQENGPIPRATTSDPEDCESVAPSDSISCVGNRRNGHQEEPHRAAGTTGSFGMRGRSVSFSTLSFQCLTDRYTVDTAPSQA